MNTKQKEEIHNVKMIYNLEWTENDKIVKLIPQKMTNFSIEKKKYKPRKKPIPSKPIYETLEKYIMKMFKNNLIDYYNLEKHVQIGKYTTYKTEEVYKFILERTIKINKSFFTFLQPKSFLQGFIYGHETFTNPLEISDTGLTNVLKILEEEKLIITHKFEKDKETLYILNIEKGRELLTLIKDNKITKKDCEQFQRMIKENVRTFFSLNFLEDKNYRFYKGSNAQFKDENLDNIKENNFGHFSKSFGDKSKLIVPIAKSFGKKSKSIGKNETQNSSKNNSLEDSLPRITPINNLEEHLDISKVNNTLNEIKNDVVVSCKKVKNEDKIESELLSLGFKEEDIKNFKKNNTDESIMACIKDGCLRFENGSIKNLEGWIRICLSKGYKVNKKTNTLKSEKKDLSIFSQLFQYFKIDKNADNNIIEQRLFFQVTEFIREVLDISKDINFRANKRIESFKKIHPIVRIEIAKTLGIDNKEEKDWLNNVLNFEKIYEKKVIQRIKEFKSEVSLSLFLKYLNYVGIDELKELIIFIEKI